MKINNKGYLMVEIIVASVIAMGLAYFILELVIDLKNRNEDYYVNTLLETDKALMTREVMNDISNYKIKSITSNNTDYVEFVFYINGEEKHKRITIAEEEGIYIFKYGIFELGTYVIDEQYYQKEFSNKLKLGEVKITNNCYSKDTGSYIECKDSTDESMKNVENGLVTISIVAKTLYSDYNYGLELNVNYKVKSMEVILEVPPVINDVKLTAETTTSFKIEVDATAKYEIDKYEYFIRKNGETEYNQIDSGICPNNSNICTIDSLDTNTKYDVKVKVTDKRSFSSELENSITLQEFRWNKYTLVDVIECKEKLITEEEISDLNKQFTYSYVPYFTNKYELSLNEDECYFIVNEADINTNSENKKEFTIQEFNTYGFNTILINEDSINKVEDKYLFKRIDKIDINNITDTEVDAKLSSYELEKVTTKGKGELVEEVTSIVNDTYPENGEKDGYWYEIIP